MYTTETAKRLIKCAIFRTEEVSFSLPLKLNHSKTNSTSTQCLRFADVCSLFVYKLFAHFFHYTVDFKPAFTIPREHIVKYITVNIHLQQTESLYFCTSTDKNTI